MLKNQEVENFADENSNSIDSQIDVDYINQVMSEPIRLCQRQERYMFDMRFTGRF